MPQIITIDGPAGAGKSTVARQLARLLDVDFLDTGAMYRGIAAHALAHGVDPALDTDKAAELAEQARMQFDWTCDPPRLHVDGVDLTDRLRDADVTGKVSDVASNPKVRQVLVKAQQRIGREHPRLVTEGRDQGSVVFPNARVKFYLDADPLVRAHRRAEQLAAMGKPVDEQAILKQIMQRDHRDQHRSDGPLICPEDAIRIDTSGLTLDQVVQTLAMHVREVLAAAGATGRLGDDPQGSA